jgi:hypothetical protein
MNSEFIPISSILILSPAGGTGERNEMNEFSSKTKIGVTHEMTNLFPPV